MQWTAGPQRRLLHAPRRGSCRGPVVSGGFAPEFVNVADQRHDPDSLLSFMKLLIRRYRESPGAGLGEVRDARPAAPAVLAHACVWDDGTMVAVHNLGAEPRTVPLTLEDCDSTHRLVDLLQDGQHAGRRTRARSSSRSRATATAGCGW